MRIPSILSVVSILAGLAACAPIQYGLQPGQTQADFVADNAKCQLVAQAMYPGGSGLLGAIGAVTIPRRDYRLCMQALGYMEAPEAPEAQPSSGSDTIAWPAQAAAPAVVTTPLPTTTPITPCGEDRPCSQQTISAF